MLKEDIAVQDLLDTATWGVPLPTALRGEMERFFNASFDEVRLRVDERLPGRGIGAMAHGEHVFIAPALFDPSRPESRALLAHELAHVLQQREGALAGFGPGRAAVVDDTALEAEADGLATLFSVVDAAGLGHLRNRVSRPASGSASAPSPRAVQCVLLHAKDAIGKVDWVARHHGYGAGQADAAKKIIESIGETGIASCGITGLDSKKYGHESTGQKDANPTANSVSVWWSQSFGAPLQKQGAHGQVTQVRNSIADAIRVCGLGTHVDEFQGKPAYRLHWRVSSGLADRFYIKSNTVTLMPAPKPKKD